MEKGDTESQILYDRLENPQASLSWRAQRNSDCRDKALTTCIAVLKKLAERKETESVSFKL